jgi:hypothetical protein
MALLKFRKPENALEFAEAYNGKVFNSMNVSPIFAPSGRLGTTAASLLTTLPARDLSCRSHNVREH